MPANGPEDLWTTTIPAHSISTCDCLQKSVVMSVCCADPSQTFKVLLRQVSEALKAAQQHSDVDFLQVISQPTARALLTRLPCGIEHVMSSMLAKHATQSARAHAGCGRCEVSWHQEERTSVPSATPPTTVCVPEGQHAILPDKSLCLAGLAHQPDCKP